MVGERLGSGRASQRQSPPVLTTIRNCRIHGRNQIAHMLEIF
jgi:hypothetical protein